MDHVFPSWFNAGAVLEGEVGAALENKMCLCCHPDSVLAMDRIGPFCRKKHPCDLVLPNFGKEIPMCIDLFDSHAWQSRKEPVLPVSLLRKI
jgi:hypothetical protein